MRNSKKFGIALLLFTFLLAGTNSFADTEVTMKGPLIDQHMETTISSPVNEQWEPVQDMTPSPKTSDTTTEGDDTSQAISSTTDENDQNSETLPAVSRLYYPSLFEE
jgi:hypothetical protein